MSHSNDLSPFVRYFQAPEHQPFVPNPRDWEEVLDRGDLGDLAGWTSLGSSRMESATEDRAALPARFRYRLAPAMAREFFAAHFSPSGRARRERWTSGWR